MKGSVALDDELAFIASRGGSWSACMRHALRTIEADEDATIRACILWRSRRRRWSWY